MDQNQKGTRAQALSLLVASSALGGRVLQMPGDGRYQPNDLKPYLGYDQWAGWLILVEWYWMKALAKMGMMPAEDAALLTDTLLKKLLRNITTTAQDSEEKKGSHDILALLALMREHLPEALHRWLHFCATSYDIINTAYALQLQVTFDQVFWPKLKELDTLWREKIWNTASSLQSGRTHLQTALPVTVGFWLAGLHNRFVSSARQACELADQVPGKFSGAVGTSASQRVFMRPAEEAEDDAELAEEMPLLKKQCGEWVLSNLLVVKMAEVSTQITPPEAMARFYHELVLLSGALANLGEDVRILQSSQFGELTSASSTSSAMSHKTSNPIAAENLAGMHASVVAEYMKVVLTLVSDLQRDLRGSNVMRSYPAVMVYTYQQILTAIRLLKSLEVDEGRCRENFNHSGKLVVAELLHLELQRLGVLEAHKFVNERVVPIARTKGQDLYVTFIVDCSHAPEISDEVRRLFRDSPIIPYLKNPETYIGDATLIAETEFENAL